MFFFSCEVSEEEENTNSIVGTWRIDMIAEWLLSNPDYVYCDGWATFGGWIWEATLVENQTINELTIDK